MIKEQTFPVKTIYNWYDISNLSEEDSRILQKDFNFTSDTRGAS